MTDASEQPKDAAGERPVDRDTRLLAEYLRDRDLSCPKCGYNLRNLTSVVCPECKEPLDLKLNPHHPKLWGFVLTIAPGLFSVPLACLLTVVNVLYGSPDSIAPPIVLALISSGVTLAIIADGATFARQPMWTQLGVAVAIWFGHALGIGVMIATL